MYEIIIIYNRIGPTVSILYPSLINQTILNIMQRFGKQIY